MNELGRPIENAEIKEKQFSEHIRPDHMNDLSFLDSIKKGETPQKETFDDAKGESCTIVPREPTKITVTEDGKKNIEVFYAIYKSRDENRPHESIKEYRDIYEEDNGKLILTERECYDEKSGKEVHIIYDDDKPKKTINIENERNKSRDENEPIKIKGKLLLPDATIVEVDSANVDENESTKQEYKTVLFSNSSDLKKTEIKDITTREVLDSIKEQNPSDLLKMRIEEAENDSKSHENLKELKPNHAYFEARDYLNLPDEKKGMIRESYREKYESLVSAITDDADKIMKNLGVDEKTRKELTSKLENVVLDQTVVSSTRGLGDHGIRHIEANHERIISILESRQREDPSSVSDYDKLAAIIANVYHDAGYMLGENDYGVNLGGRDKNHDLYSLLAWYKDAPEFKTVFAGKEGEEAYNKIPDTIGVHNSSNAELVGKILNDRDPVIFTVAFADKVALSANEKIPEIAYDNSIVLSAFSYTDSFLEGLSRKDENGEPLIDNETIEKLRVEISNELRTELSRIINPLSQENKDPQNNQHYENIYKTTAIEKDVNEKSGRFSEPMTRIAVDVGWENGRPRISLYQLAEIEKMDSSEKDLAEKSFYKAIKDYYPNPNPDADSNSKESAEYRDTIKNYFEKAKDPEGVDINSVHVEIRPLSEAPDIVREKISQIEKWSNEVDKGRNKAAERLSSAIDNETITIERLSPAKDSKTISIFENNEFTLEDWRLFTQDSRLEKLKTIPDDLNFNDPAEIVKAYRSGLKSLIREEGYYD